MSLRTFERWMIAGAMSLGTIAATGCSDDSSDPAPTDGGAKDAGKVDAGPDEEDDIDAASVDAGKPTLTNADGETCAPVVLEISGGQIGACWVDEEAQKGCGLDPDDVPGDDKATDLPCAAQDVPGTPSDYCGEFFDQVDGVDDGYLTQQSGPLELKFAGCCLPTGECGAVLSEAYGANGKPINGVNLHFGCTGIAALTARLPSSGGEPPVIANPPFCTPATGAFGCPPVMGALCASLKGAGVPVTCDETTPTPNWACVLGKLPKDGETPALSGCLEGITELAHGCGTVEGATNCIPGLPANLFGCEDYTAATVPGQPVYACGCGDGVVAANCIPNVPATVCGDQPATTEQLASIPEFLCGCTNNPAQDLGCLRNVDTAVCGTYQITNAGAPSVSASVLSSVPTFVCGCGPTIRDTATGSACMSGVETTTCGTYVVPVNTKSTEATTDDCLINVPEYARGCGSATPTLTAPCLIGAPAFFGCVDTTVTTAPGNKVRRLPEYLCGCGEAKPQGAGTGDQGLPCLPFTAETFCGALPISAPGQITPVIPNSVCGCGDGVTTQAAPCLDNVPFAVCGQTPVCGTSGVGACANGLSCNDKKGGEGSGAGGVGGAGDGIKDICE